MKIRKIMAIMAALVLSLSCMGAAVAEGDVPTLVISTWPANIDTISANVFKPFEEANNCKIPIRQKNPSDRKKKVAAS